MRFRLSILRVVRGTKLVWLVGMMGAGKSTVGPVLGARLGRPFIDTDTEVERRAGCPIAEIFAQQGEAAFRRLEAEVVEAATREHAVVALGGGAIAQPGAAERLAATGTVVYLRASPERLVLRIDDPSKRPLLAGLGPEERAERVRALLVAREPCYRSAKVTIDTEHTSVSDIVEELVVRIAEAEASETEGSRS